MCPRESGKCPILDLGEEVDRAECDLIKNDGSSIPVLKSVIPIRLHDEDVLLETFVDITERRQAEEEVRKHVKEMERRHRLVVGRS